MGYFPSQKFVLPTGEHCTIRTATARDAAQILQHVKHVSSETNFLITTPEEVTFTEEQERIWIEQHTEHPDALLLVAEIDSQIVGVLNFRGGSHKRLAHQGTFGVSVRQPWQGNGIGRRLIETMLRWAEENPTIEKVCLEVFASNAAALHLYRSLGFVEEGRRVRQVKLNATTYVDDILMAKFVK